MSSRVAWLMLLYQLPSRPSTQRVYVWRRLKQLGAVYLQNSVCVLPEGASRPPLEALRLEIQERKGDARVLPITLATPDEDERMKDLFRRQSEEDYGELLGKCRDFHEELKKERAARHFTYAELEENEEELAKIEAWFTKVERRDFFGAPARDRAVKAVDAARRDLDRYRLQVADAEGVHAPPRVGDGRREAGPAVPPGKRRRTRARRSR
jgi:hypothetical protein